MQVACTIASAVPRADLRNWLAAGFFAGAAALPAAAAAIDGQRALEGLDGTLLISAPGLALLAVAAFRIRPRTPASHAYPYVFALVLAQAVLVFLLSALVVPPDSRLMHGAFAVGRVSALLAGFVALFAALPLSDLSVRGRMLFLAECAYLGLAAFMIPV